MRIYEDQSHSPDEWFIISVLRLEDDGTFHYDELWTSYLGNAGGEAHGRWRQNGHTIFFRAERAEGDTYLRFSPGQEQTAIEQDNILSFGGGLTYRLRGAAPNLQRPFEGGSSPVPVLLDDESVKIAPSPAAISAIGRAEPVSLSPELISLVSQWIDELPAEGFQNRISRLCKKFRILPLHTTSIYLWGLSLDGSVMCVDHEAFSDTPEPETNPVNTYAALVQGARTYPELEELIPLSPGNARRCDLCGGSGWKESPGETAECCFRCNSMGWY